VLWESACIGVHNTLGTMTDKFDVEQTEGAVRLVREVRDQLAVHGLIAKGD